MLLVLLIIVSSVKETTPSKKVDSKIVGGRAILGADFIPFIVSVQIKNSGHNCGGSLLSPVHVLSACHCLAVIDSEGVEPLSTDSYVFVAGLMNLSQTAHAQLREAKKFHIHPNCGKDPWAVMIYDFSVGEMEKPFAINQFVKPFKLLSSDPDVFNRKMFNLMGDENTECQVAGWGVTQRGYVENPVASDVLNVVRMYVIPEGKCQKLYGVRNPKFRKFPFSKYNQLCTISLKGDSSDCQGDSGGPFFCGDYVIGVISYGFECGTPMPNVYTSLADFLKWFPTNGQNRSKHPAIIHRTKKIHDSNESEEKTRAQPRDTNGDFMWEHSFWLLVLILVRSWFSLLPPWDY